MRQVHLVVFIHHCSPSAWHRRDNSPGWEPEAWGAFHVACPVLGPWFHVSLGSGGTHAPRVRPTHVRAPPVPPTPLPTPPCPALRSAPPTPFPPRPHSVLGRARVHSSMGKAAAPTRGGGCAGRSRGLSSLFTVVPCLSCHTAAPGMNSSTSGSGPEPKPQLQPVQAPERELLDEQVCKPGFDPVPRSEPESQTTSVAGPSGAGQESELQGLCQDSEAGPRVGAGPFTQTTPEQLPLGSTAGTVPRSGPKPQALQRQGQAKTSAGSPGPGIGLPMVSPPLDSYKGWLLKWTNYLKGYQRRWFVLGNGLLSYYRYGSAGVWGIWEIGG